MTDVTCWDVEKIRQNFPILAQMVNDKPLIYFDNAATTQKPQSVIEAVHHFYQNDNANVHRGVHALSTRATQAFDEVREKVRRFINAPLTAECIFVRGTTEAINLVAHSFVMPRLNPGDEILISAMEHHANIVPWQLVCQQTGATLRVAPINQKGEILLEEYAQQFTPRTKFVALNYASNALGTINPVKKMIDIAHEHQVPVLLDGAQATAHLPIDIHALDCDFYAFSSHKMYGPAGIGVLWGKTCWLEEMRPYQGGGEMIQYVTFAKTEYAPIPAKFEAGTPNIEGVIGLGAAIDYLDSLDMTQVMAYEHQLCCHATESLKRLGDYRLIGEADDKVPVVSFVHPTIHAHDIGTILDTQGVAIRSGHHCAMPIMDFYGVAATTRLSLSFYNTLAEIDAFIAVLAQVKEVFA